MFWVSTIGSKIIVSFKDIDCVKINAGNYLDKIISEWNSLQPRSLKLNIFIQYIVQTNYCLPCQKWFQDNKLIEWSRASSDINSIIKKKI